MGCCEMRLAQLGALVSAGRSAGRADDSRAIGRENLVLEGDFRVLSHSDGHFRGALTGEWTCGAFLAGRPRLTWTHIRVGWLSTGTRRA